jgi:uncharacterized protein YeaO (DUF488 family)
MIKIKRAYQPVEKEDGLRILVDRLWPRGVSKEKAELDIWLKDIAPSNELRKWYAHDPERWQEFREGYLEELNNKKTLLSYIRDLEKENGIVTLIYAAKDEEHSNAVVLLDKLQGSKTIKMNINRVHG